MKKSIFCLMVIACVLVHAEVERKVVQRQRALVRSGAGLFYPIIAELSQGTPSLFWRRRKGGIKSRCRTPMDTFLPRLPRPLLPGMIPFSGCLPVLMCGCLAMVCLPA